MSSPLRSQWGQWMSLDPQEDTVRVRVHRLMYEVLDVELWCQICGAVETIPWADYKREAEADFNGRWMPHCRLEGQLEIKWNKQWT
jgi:hypothetical protein